MESPHGSLPNLWLEQQELEHFNYLDAFDPVWMEMVPPPMPIQQTNTVENTVDAVPQASIVRGQVERHQEETSDVLVEQAPVSTGISKKVKVSKSKHGKAIGESAIEVSLHFHFVNVIINTPIVQRGHLPQCPLILQEVSLY
jgi:hypothetical protein